MFTGAGRGERATAGAERDFAAFEVFLHQVKSRKASPANWRTTHHALATMRHMDQAWVAVIGAAIGSAGATGAALVAGWSGRCQASVQVSSEQEHWRRQMRRDAYGALLRAGAEARDELGSLLTRLRDKDTTYDSEWLASRLSEIKPLINAVRLATAAVFIEGPSTILEPAKRVEDGIVLFHTAMLAVAKESSGSHGGNAANFIAICSQQRVSVRAVLTDFAAAARAAIDGEPIDPIAAAPANAAESAQELSWLIRGMSEVLGIPETRIDPDLTLWESELDSLTILALTVFFEREYGMVIELGWFLKLSRHSLREIASLLATLRAGDGSTAGRARPSVEESTARAIEPSAAPS